MKARFKLSSILLPIVLLVTFFVMPAKSNVELLPQIEYNGAIEVRNISTILIEKINSQREFYNLPPVQESSILNHSALYKSIYMSQYSDNGLFVNDFTSGPLAGTNYLMPYPYVKYEDITYITDGKFLSDETVTEYFIETWKNAYKQGKGIYNPDIKLMGLSILWFNIGGNSYTICIMHSATDDTIPIEADRVPENIMKSDAIPPVVKTKEVYVAKDLVLSKDKITDSVMYSDNSGKECLLNFDVTQINTLKTGIYDLNVSVKDMAGNITEAIVKVHVVPHIYPVINNEEIILPAISFDDVYEISRYINISDNFGIENITVNPSVVNKGETGKQVTVNVRNKAGLSTSKTISVKFADLPLYVSPSVTVNAIYPDVNEPFTKDMIKAAIITKDDYAAVEIDTESFEKVDLSVKGIYYVKATVNLNDIYTVTAVPVYTGSEGVKTGGFILQTNSDLLAYSKLNKEGTIVEDDHIILSAEDNQFENAVYFYTFKNYEGEEYTIRRSIPSVIWNPDEQGLYNINLKISNRETGEIYETSNLHVYVEEKTITETKTPYIGLSDVSTYIADDVDKKVYNISPSTKADEFIKNFVIFDEGITDLNLRIKDKNGNILDGTKYVGTGSIIELYKDGTIYESYVILLYGDVNGDGKIDISDYVIIRQCLFKTTELSGMFFEAGNIENRNVKKIDISDYVRLRKHLFKIELIGQQ